MEQIDCSARARRSVDVVLARIEGRGQAIAVAASTTRADCGKMMITVSTGTGQHWVKIRTVRCVEVIPFAIDTSHVARGTIPWLPLT